MGYLVGDWCVCHLVSWPPHYLVLPFPRLSRTNPLAWVRWVKGVGGWWVVGWLVAYIPDLGVLLGLLLLILPCSGL